MGATVLVKKSMALYVLDRPDDLPKAGKIMVLGPGKVALDYMVKLLGEDALHRAIHLKHAAEWVEPVG